MTLERAVGGQLRYYQNRNRTVKTVQIGRFFYALVNIPDTMIGRAGRAVNRSGEGLKQARGG
jgi:hypothetical protein